MKTEYARPGSKGKAVSRRDFIRDAVATTCGAAVLCGAAKTGAGAEERKASPPGKGPAGIGVRRLEIKGDGFNVPAAVFSPEKSSRAAVVVHGYGGSKEEQLGLAWRIAERGITACAIDLRGHGEHRLLLDDKIMLDVTAAVKHCRSYGQVVAIGHSLGGRLALLSDAEFAIGISPALNSTFSPPTMKLLKELRSYRVREQTDDAVFDLFKKLPLYTPSKARSVLMLYGERDVPEIKEACSALASRGEKVVRIDKALHADIFLLEPTFERIERQLDEWFRKG